VRQAVSAPRRIGPATAPTQAYVQNIGNQIASAINLVETRKAQLSQPAPHCATSLIIHKKYETH